MMNTALLDTMPGQKYADGKTIFGSYVQTFVCGVKTKITACFIWNNMCTPSFTAFENIVVR
jgi:hypothetical protein